MILFFAVNGLAASPDGGVIKTDVVTISVENQHDTVMPGGKSSLAIHFELKKDWHFYASAKTAPGEMNLKLTPSSEDTISFSEPIFPKPHLYFDKSVGKKLEVFSDKFTVYLPFNAAKVYLTVGQDVNVDVKVGIEGAVCSDIQCRVPDFGQLSTEVKISYPSSEAKFVLPEAAEAIPSIAPRTTRQWGDYPVWFALGLALLAGLSLNIMPCVWPVLPLVVLRIVEQAKTRASSKLTMGIAFCIGILLFFACLATANIVLRVSFDTTLQWGDQFRNPVFIKVMALVLVVLALFMFDVFTITLPGSLAGGDTDSGFTGTVGMGFLAALLSTPCSFAILAAAFAWAQAQPLLPATIVIMFIGVGMAVPYLVLASIPGLLESLPKPGKWMDIFKKAVGFILLTVAVWLITVVPQETRAGVLFYSLVLAFCVWMWGSWVGFSSKTSSKIIVRTIAVLLAVTAGYWLLSPPAKMIDWKKYDADLIEKSLANNKPVLIKFTADWCLSCKAVEILVYDRKDIAELIKQKEVVPIKADTTAIDALATKALKNIYNEPGVPVSILLLPNRKEPFIWRDKNFTNDLKKALENVNN